MTFKRLDVAELQTKLLPQARACELHGEYEATGILLNLKQSREIWSRCPGCKADEDAVAVLAREKLAIAARVASLERMLGDTSLPERFLFCGFDDYVVQSEEQATALATMKGYAEDFQRHLRLGTPLILSGGPGTGKTHLAAAVVRSILPRHVGVYTTAIAMIRTVRSTWEKGSSRSEGAVINELARAPLLVIDEVGVQYGSMGEVTLLTEIMDLRYRNVLPTILISNENVKGLKAYVGDRVYDRLRQGGILIEFTWSSYRKIAGDLAKEST